MSILVQVGYPVVCCDPMLPFVSPAGKQALRLFKAGAVLSVGCYPHETPPHTWMFILPDNQRIPLTNHSTIALGLKQIASLSIAQPPRAPQSSITDDSVAHWVFDAMKFATLQKRWKKAKVCIADWERHKGPSRWSANGLGEQAMATLRYLQQSYAMCMHPELLDVWLELNSRGLIDITPQGGVTLSSAGRRIKLAKGPSLVMRYPLKDISGGNRVSRDCPSKQSASVFPM